MKYPSEVNDLNVQPQAGAHGCSGRAQRHKTVAAAIASLKPQAGAHGCLAAPSDTKHGSLDHKMCFSSEVPVILKAC
jgi:hypothetical protein